MNYALFSRISSILSVCVMVIGFAGNVIVCTVILCNRSMNTVTNFYLFNLAISDLLILIANALGALYLYLELWMYDMYSLFSWSVVYEWISKVAVAASSLIMTAFTCERYLAICHPFLARSLPEKSRVKKIIIILWLIAAILSFITETGWFIMTTPLAESIRKQSEIFLWYAEGIFMTLHFFIPMLAITVMYILIGVELLKSSKMAEIVARTGDRDIGKALKLFVFIIVAFFLCWTPYYMNTIFDMHRYTDYQIIDVSISFMAYNSMIKEVTCVIYPSLNPLIYTLMSKKFRDAAKNLLSRDNNQQLEETQMTEGSTHV